MAIRKPRKTVSSLKSYWEPPIGTPEVNNEPSRTIPDQGQSTSDLVAKYLKGDLTINRRGNYDPLDLKTVPPERQRGATIPTVVKQTKDELVRNAVQLDYLQQQATQQTKANALENSTEGRINKGEARVSASAPAEQQNKAS